MQKTFLLIHILDEEMDSSKRIFARTQIWPEKKRNDQQTAILVASGYFSVAV